MKAAVLTTLNAPLELWDLEHVFHRGESYCAPGQVLVDVVASGICGSQLKEIAGEKGNKDYVPHLLGHEGVGIVRDVGQGVSVQLKGRKCVMHWRKGNGAEAFLPARYEAAQNRTIGGGHITTLCESAVVSANRITPVPDDVPDELCALLGCGLSTALATIEQEAKVKIGESVLIVGCGGVGLNLIQGARLACAYPIVAMDVVEKAEVCGKLGAHLFWNPKKGCVSPLGLEVSVPRKFDVIIDTSGSVEALESTIPLLADGGRFIMVGQPKPGESFRIMGALDLFHQQRGCRIQTTQGGGFRPTEMIPRYINLWRSGALNLTDIISHRFHLADVNRGIDLVRAGQAGRVLISMR